MGEVKQWPKAVGTLAARPARFDKAADYELYNAVRQLELQWGTIEAHNRLAEWCDILRARVEAGRAATPHPWYANELRPPLFKG